MVVHVRPDPIQHTRGKFVHLVNDKEGGRAQGHIAPDPTLELSLKYKTLDHSGHLRLADKVKEKENSKKSKHKYLMESNRVTVPWKATVSVRIVFTHIEAFQTIDMIDTREYINH